MINNIPEFETPYHLIDIEQLERNLSILQNLKAHTNCKILYALKAFSNNLLFKYIKTYLDGVCASGLYEAKLGKEFFKKEVHTFSTTYKVSEIKDISTYSDFVIFNSFSQWKRYNEIVRQNHAVPAIRINPEYSEIKRYNVNPCHQYSRFGVHQNELKKIMKEQLTYIHVHNMCEQFSDTLIKSSNFFLKEYEKYLYEIDILNLGGGQLFTDPQYNIDDAIQLLNFFQKSYDIKLYLEPGEAILLNTGYLVTRVVDIVENGMKTAIVDAPAICHLPDIVYSNIRYKIKNGYDANEKKYTYRIAGSSCYAGDLFGDYSFDEPLHIGSEIIFCNTADYTMVKSTMFNGIRLPSLVFYTAKEGYQMQKEYDYNTFLSII